MSVHEIIGGELGPPTPWQVGSIFRSFVRTKPLRSAIFEGQVPLLGSEVLFSERYPFEVILSWGLSARFVFGSVDLRTETWAWNVAERRPPFWIEDGPPPQAYLVVPFPGSHFDRWITSAESIREASSKGWPSTKPPLGYTPYFGDSAHWVDHGSPGSLP